jgi:hypothetical protein
MRHRLVPSHEFVAMIETGEMVDAATVAAYALLLLVGDKDCSH